MDLLALLSGQGNITQERSLHTVVSIKTKYGVTTEEAKGMLPSLFTTNLKQETKDEEEKLE